MAETGIQEKGANRGKTVVRVLRIVGFALLVALFIGLLVHALLSVFVKRYYPTFGHSRLFAVVTDSMEPEIAAGSMIVCRVPQGAGDIEVGTVITFEVTDGKAVTLLTHRVVEIRVDEASGTVRYVTRGDNAGGVDAVRPRFEDVVGVYTGRKCGFFGYVVGFLQSSQGAIALILIAMIGLIVYIVVRFIGLVNTWRAVAVAALRKSGTLLAETENESLTTIADVIGIVVKDPYDRKDVRRKDRKLHWFLKTGALPKRPYADDLEIDPASVDARETSIVLDPPAAETETPQTAGTGTPQIAVETCEQVRYAYTYAARLARLQPQSKEWYVRLKNELLSYVGVRAKTAKGGERFSVGRQTVGRLTVRGKTLCLALTVEASAYAGGKYRIERARDGSLVYRIRSERRAKYALELIADAMRKFAVEKDPTYLAQDFYVPYAGVYTLMQQGLVKRDTRLTEKKYRIEEVDGDE